MTPYDFLLIADDLRKWLLKPTVHTYFEEF